MNAKSGLYYADCYDKMAKKDLAIYGVCTGKIKTEDDERYICIDCPKCPYWAYMMKKEAQ